MNRSIFLVLVLALTTAAHASGFSDRVKSLHVTILKPIRLKQQDARTPDGTAVKIAAFYQNQKPVLFSSLNLARPYCMVIGGSTPFVVRPQGTPHWWDSRGFGTDSAPGDFRFVFEASARDEHGDYFRLEFYCFRKDAELTRKDTLGAFGAAVRLQMGLRP